MENTLKKSAISLKDWWKIRWEKYPYSITLIATLGLGSILWTGFSFGFIGGQNGVISIDTIIWVFMLYFTYKALTKSIEHNEQQTKISLFKERMDFTDRFYSFMTDKSKLSHNIYSMFKMSTDGNSDAKKIYDALMKNPDMTEASSDIQLKWVKIVNAILRQSIEYSKSLSYYKAIFSTLKYPRHLKSKLMALLDQGDNYRKDAIAKFEEFKEHLSSKNLDRARLKRSLEDIAKLTENFEYFMKRNYEVNVADLRSELVKSAEL